MKIFPELQTPLIEYGTDKLVPAHTEDVEIANVFN